jgi:hypothetical protein
MQQPAMIDNGNAPGDGLLKAFLCDRDVACPQCDYNLRNLHGSRCPECGEVLTLGVNLVEPRQKLLIAGLIGLAAGVGFNGLLMIYLCIQMLERHWGGRLRYVPSRQRCGRGGRRRGTGRVALSMAADSPGAARRENFIDARVLGTDAGEFCYFFSDDLMNGSRGA